MNQHFENVTTFDEPMLIHGRLVYNVCILTGDELIYNVHDVENCEGKNCCIHNPSDHHMKDWPQHWREDRLIMERICSCGVGHPDPDEINPDTVHGCCGCCVEENDIIAIIKIGTQNLMEFILNFYHGLKRSMVNK